MPSFVGSDLQCIKEFVTVLGTVQGVWLFSFEHMVFGFLYEIIKKSIIIFFQFFSKTRSNPIIFHFSTSTYKILIIYYTIYHLKVPLFKLKQQVKDGY